MKTPHSQVAGSRSQGLALSWACLTVAVAVVAILFMVLAGSAVAGPFEDGMAAYNKGDFAKAVRIWRPLAEKGDLKAQFVLGEMYSKGQGVLKDHAEAAKWFRKAAEQGHAVAQNYLGLLYAYGLQVPQDYAEAVKWHRRAAEQGDVNGQNNLGNMYFKGLGVLQDYSEAVKWYRRAADQGEAAGQLNIGAMYYNGYGVPKDYIQAYMWFNLAASRYRPGEGQNNAIKARDQVTEQMTPAQIAEAQRLAREWKPTVQQAIQWQEIDRSRLIPVKPRPTQQK